MKSKYLKSMLLFCGLLFISISVMNAQSVVYVYLSEGSVAVYDRVDSLVCTVEEQKIYTDGKTYCNPISDVDSVIYDSMPFVTPGQLVDLGLSVKWAGWNVGASRPEEYGGYYAWGELNPKSDYSLETYLYYDKENDEFKIIGNNISGTQYDVAYDKWGEEWRMPTWTECQELIDRCTWIWMIYNGVKGQKVIGLNENSIFIPASGYRNGRTAYDQGSYGFYWSGTLDSDYYVYGMGFSYDDIHTNWVFSRDNGHPVRPVSE